MNDSEPRSVDVADMLRDEALGKALLAPDSPNFIWFRARYPRFVYVDRIVVAPSARGRGCARRLYDDLFEHTARAGHDRVVCEVNKTPPNPASDAFHAALGFVEVGSASVHGGSRTVRYLSHTPQER